MPLRIWIQRLKEIRRIMGFRRRSSRASVAARSREHFNLHSNWHLRGADSSLNHDESSQLRCWSPHSGEESLCSRAHHHAQTRRICLSPVDEEVFQQENHGCSASPSLSFSPFSPLSSPALLNTPVVCPHNSPPADHRASSDQISSQIAHTSRSSSDPVARVVAAPFGVGCGCRAPLASTLRKAKKNLQAFNASMRCSYSYERKIGAQINTSFGEEKKGTPSRKWTGAWFMLFKVEKRLVRTKAVLRKRTTKHGMMRRTTTNSAQSAVRSSPAASCESFIARNSRGKESVPPKKRREEHAGSTNTAADGRKSSRNAANWSDSCGTATLDTKSCSNSWRKDQFSIHSDETFFTSVDRGRRSESSISSTELLEKYQCGSGEDRYAMGARDSSSWKNIYKELKETDMKCAPPCVLTEHLLRACPSDSFYPSTANTYSEASEEEQLLHAEIFSVDSPNRRSSSAYKTDTDSNPSNTISPWLQCNYDAASSCFSSVDLEANAKAWEQKSPHWLLSKIYNGSTINPIAAKNHDHGSNKGQSIKINRREDAAIIRRKYRKAYGQPLMGHDQKTIVLPVEITTGQKNNIAVTTKPSTLLQLQDSKFKQMLMSSTVQGNKVVGDSLAVEKCSKDPYVDFRDSMVDMILEKQINKVSDLEELLQCFLSLNSLEHHDLIVRAFTEVWEKVFGQSIGSSFCT